MSRNSRSETELHHARRQSWFLSEPAEASELARQGGGFARAVRAPPAGNGPAGPRRGTPSTSGRPCGTASASPPGRCSSWRWWPASSSGSHGSRSARPSWWPSSPTASSPCPPTPGRRKTPNGCKRSTARKCSSAPTVPWESKESGVAELRRQLAAAQPGGPHKDLVVLYLSMPGAVDGQAEPCLIPPGASPWKSDQWLRVRDLLGQLFPKDRSAQSRAGRGQETADPRRHPHGRQLEPRAALQQLRRAAASRAARVEHPQPVRAQFDRAGTDRLGRAGTERLGLRLLSLARARRRRRRRTVGKPRQGGLASGTAALSEGLRRTMGDGESGRRARADAVAGGRRLPHRLPPFQPADHDSRRRAKPTRGGSRSPRSGRSTRNSAGKAPIASSRWPGRSSSRNCCGSNNWWKRERLTKASSTTPGNRPSRWPRRSIAIRPAATWRPTASRSLRQFGGWPSAAELAAVPAPWKKPPAGRQAGGRSPVPPAKAGAEAGRRPPDPIRTCAASAAAWEWLLADPSHVGDLPAALKFLDGADQRPPHDLIEIHFLRMLAEHLDPPLLADRRRPHSSRALGPATWPSRPRRRPTRGRSTGSSHPWRRPTNRAATRRIGCLSARPRPLPRPTRSGKRSRRERTGGRYAAAIHRADEIAAAFQLRDRAWAEIPYLAQWILARQQNAESADGQLRQAIDGTRALSAKLDEHLGRRSSGRRKPRQRRRASTPPCRHWTACSRRNAPS